MTMMFEDVLVPPCRLVPEVVESEINAGAAAPDDVDTEESVADQLSALPPVFDTVMGNCVFPPGIVMFMVDGDTAREGAGVMAGGLTGVTPVPAGPSTNLTIIVRVPADEFRFTLPV